MIRSPVARKQLLVAVGVRPISRMIQIDPNGDNLTGLEDGWSAILQSIAVERILQLGVAVKQKHTLV